jgi:nucleotide-binding universal stress UspA family protein
MATLAEVRHRVFGYIEADYNRKRIHTAIGMPPAEWEIRCAEGAPSAEFSEASVAPSVGREKTGAHGDAYLFVNATHICVLGSQIFVYQIKNGAMVSSAFAGEIRESVRSGIPLLLCDKRLQHAAKGGRISYGRRLVDCWHIVAQIEYRCATWMQEILTLLCKRRRAMIPQLKQILYATDLSPNSAYAFRYAAASARKHDARIVILHVLEKLPPTIEAQLHTYLSDEQLNVLRKQKSQALVDRIRRRLDGLCESELAEDPQFRERIDSIEIRDGFPPEVILHIADELDCDIIILGDHGKGIVKSSLLGSTCHHVLRHTKKPTYVIPLPEGETEVTFHDEV